MKVLLVSESVADQALIEQSLQANFQQAHCLRVATLSELNAALAQGCVAVLTTPQTGALSAEAVLQTVRVSEPTLPVILWAAQLDWQATAKAFKAGFSDCLPTDAAARLPAVLQECLTHQQAARAALTTENELRQSEERYRYISALGSDYAYVYRIRHDGEFQVEWISEAFTRMTSYTAAEVEARGGWRTIIDQADLPKVLQTRERLAAGEAVELEYRVIAKNGEVIWVHNQERPITEPGAPYKMRVVGASQNVTQRRLAEESLRENEARLLLALEAAGMNSWEYNIVNDWTIGTRDREFLGTAPSTLAEFLEVVHPDDRTKVREAGERAVLEGRYYCEYRIQREQLHWYAATGHTYVDAAGEVERIIGVTQDITDRKRAETVLRENEARLRLALEAVGMTTWEWDAVDDLMRIDDRFQTVTQIAATSTAQIRAAIHPEDLARVDAAARQAVAENGRMSVEFRVPLPDQQVRWMAVVGRALAGSDEQPNRLLGVTQDITERRLLEEERQRLLQREQTARLRAEAAIQRLTAIQSITDAVLATLNLEELLRALLERICAALHSDAATILLRDAAANEWVVRASHGLDQALKEGQRFTIGQGIVGRIAAENEAMIFNDLSETIGGSGLTGLLGNRTRSLIGAPLRAGERVVGIVHVGTAAQRSFTDEDLALLQVVADRVASAIERATLYEQLLLGRNQLRTLSRQLIDAQEFERRRIARELHDETGQALTAVKLNLLSLRQTALDTTFRGKLEAALVESIDIVESSLQQVRQLSHELRPTILDDLGLVAALRWFLDRQSQRAGLVAQFKATGEPERLAPEVETACFRIVQEAMTNVIRHAAATRVEVELRFAPSESVLIFNDDGIGFNVKFARQQALKGGNMGLLGMQERAQLAGGQMEITSGKRGGTTIQVTFPRAVAQA